MNTICYNFLGIVGNVSYELCFSAPSKREFYNGGNKPPTMPFLFRSLLEGTGAVRRPKEFYNGASGKPRPTHDFKFDKK